MINRRKAIEYKYPDLQHDNGNGGDYEVKNRDMETGAEEFSWDTNKYPKPTKTELQLWTDQAIIDQKRSIEYAPPHEYLDMLWHAIDVGVLDKTSEFYLSRKLIKDNNPKK